MYSIEYMIYIERADLRLKQDCILIRLVGNL